MRRVKVMMPMVDEAAVLRLAVPAMPLEMMAGAESLRTEERPQAFEQRVVCDPL